MPAIQQQNTTMLSMKNRMGTKIILKFDPTKSEAASSTANEICKLFHRHKSDITYKPAKTHTPIAPYFRPFLKLFEALYTSYHNDTWYISSLRVIIRNHKHIHSDPNK